MPQSAMAQAPAARLTTVMTLTVALSAAAVLAEVLLFAVSPARPAALLIAWNTTVAVVWIVAGVVAWARHPGLRTGPLMVAVGLLWLPLVLYSWRGALAVTFASTLDYLGVAVTLHLFLAFPSGRLRTRLERALVATAYADAIVIGGLLPQLFLGAGDDWCRDCGRNLLLIHSDATIADGMRDVAAGIGVGLSVWVAVLLVRRWQRASAAGRAVLGPVLVTGAVVMVANLGVIVTEWFGLGSGQVAAIAASIAWALVPLGFLFGLLRARLRRASVTALMVELGELPPPQDVRDALARAVGDPSLELMFWIAADGGYVDVDGRPTALPAAEPERAVTVLEHHDERFAALVHDPFILEDRELLEAVGAAARLAIENARLQAELRAQLDEVRASRARIVEAGDRERRRIERDLHDGAQQRLLAIRLALRMAQGRLNGEAHEVQSLLAEADDEMRAALDELRSLARGIHPAVLTDMGLAAAVAGLARRAPVPVELRGVPEQRLPAGVEAAAYFVTSEALANVAKYANASEVTIAMALRDGCLHIDIDDDGVGGADSKGGSGLSGLQDRVQALDGRLRIDSPVGAGTRLHAELPVASLNPRLLSA
jgi:signal transduction histidine kinase